MGTVKSAFEKAMERIKDVEVLSAEEREELKDRERMKAVLAEFYRGALTRDQIWEKMRGLKPYLLREAQLNMSDSLRIGNLSEELLQRRDGILAIETLKETQNTAAIEAALNVLGRVQKEYAEVKEGTIQELRRAIEQNPQLRMRQVRTADGRTTVQPISVEEAIRERMTEFLSEHDKRYEAMFVKAAERLKAELR